jgi:mRNA interferase RelE/StbE
MNVVYRKSFARDLKSIRGQGLLDRIQGVIQEVEAAPRLQTISNLEKISGTTNFFRIRVGEYRIGIAVEGETVEFVRCLPRREIYRFFP